MRFAREIYDKHRGRQWFNDAQELGMSVGATGLLQAIFSDMSLGEIAGMGVIGAGAGYGGKYAFRRGGRALGKTIDKRLGNSPVSMTEIQQRHQSVLGDKPLPLGDDLNKGLKNLVKDRVTAAYTRPDGSTTGLYEGMLGGIGNQAGDNVSIMGFGALAAAAMNDDKD